MMPRIIGISYYCTIVTIEYHNFIHTKNDLKVTKEHVEPYRLLRCFTGSHIPDFYGRVNNARLLNTPLHNDTTSKRKDKILKLICLNLDLIENQNMCTLSEQGRDRNTLAYNPSFFIDTWVYAWPQPIGSVPDLTDIDLPYQPQNKCQA